MPRPSDRHFLLYLCCFLANEANSSFNVYRLGTVDGTSWRNALSVQPGNYLIVDEAGNTTDQVPITSPANYETWEETLTVVIDSVDSQWLRPYFVPDTLNLAQDGVRNRIPRGISDNVATSDGCSNQHSGVGKVLPMFDGNPNTAAFFAASNTTDRTERISFYVQNAVIDLGTNYPINRVRFFPRLGTNNPRLNELLGQFSAPKLTMEDLAEEDYSVNFLRWFEVAGANSRSNFAASCYHRDRVSPWFRSIPWGAMNSKNDPNLTLLRREEVNQNIVVDFSFPIRDMQWVAVRPINPVDNWEIAEFEVFGHGFVRRAVYQTAILDLAESMAFGNIRWDGERDRNARLLVRTRSGSDPDPLLYWAQTTIPGEYREVTREEYMRTSFRERKTTLDQNNWSFWSPPYAWTAGREDTSALPWEDGTPILSPSPARYFQLQLVFLSELEASVRLRNMELQFARPAAEELVAEAWPLDASGGEISGFTYCLRPTFSDANLGFDRLEIFTLTRANSVRSVRVDGIEYKDQFPPLVLSDRVVVGFPKLSGMTDTFKLLEVEFDTRVIKYGTEFQGWVYNNNTSGIKQMVTPGDANPIYPGNALGIRTTGLGSSVLSPVVITPNPFTPNADGLNDAIDFNFRIHELNVPRELSLSIYDLSGRLIRRIDEGQVLRGIFGTDGHPIQWDGRSDQGIIASPGIYFYRISVKADKKHEVRTGTLALSY